MSEPETTECRYCNGSGRAPAGTVKEVVAILDRRTTACGFCDNGRVKAEA